MLAKLALRKFTIGERYEIYIPYAKQMEDKLNCTFADSVGYTFTATAKDMCMLWTNDIIYGDIGGVPSPAPHPEWGSPLPQQLLKFIRPVTDE